MAISRASSIQSIKLSSTTTSETSNESSHSHSIETRVCLIGDTSKNEELKQQLKVGYLPVFILVLCFIGFVVVQIILVYLFSFGLTN